MKLETIYAGCVVQRKGRDVLLCAMQEAKSTGNTSFHVLLGEDWYAFREKPHWAISGMAGIHDQTIQDTVVVACAADGRTWELTPTTKAEVIGMVADEDCGITRMATLSDGIWACGMARVAWRRESAGNWVNVSAPEGLVKTDGITGFMGIGEIEPGVVVAAGWKGEIWSRSGGIWRREDSPSNSNFNNLSCGLDGQAVIVGDRGGIVVGQPGRWRALDGMTDFNLQGVCHFDKQVFVCTDFDIFRLEDDRLHLEDRFAAGDRPRTCMNFIVGESGVYSQGERDLFQFQGDRWNRII